MRAALLSFVPRNIDEIRGDRALRAIGALLASTHLWTFLHWLIVMPVARLLTVRDPICWPFWESCHEYRVLDANDWHIVLCVYLVAALVPIVLFLEKRWTAAAWWALLAVNVLKLAIVVQDYQLRMNQHYMAGLATIVFLFFPGKRDLVRVAVVSFYFAAGLLKLDTEWLSGAALYTPVWFFHGALLPWACAYVVVLELVIVWGLLAKRAWIFWPALAQVVVFQIFSWPVVGFFYPLVMFSLLGSMVLVRVVPDPVAPDRLHPIVALATRRAPRSSYVYIAVFALLQCVPRVFPGDSALTGEGRMFAVHMFDAIAVCNAYAMVHLPGGGRRSEGLLRGDPLRIRCDPLVIWNRAKALCRRRAQRRPSFDDLDLYLHARRRSDPAMRPVIALRRFCTATPTYDIWRHNDWILVSGAGVAASRTSWGMLPRSLSAPFAVLRWNSGWPRHCSNPRPNADARLTGPLEPAGEGECP